jgi:hypothetical protein
MKMFYEMIYRSFRPPWDIGGREELVGLVDQWAHQAGTRYRYRLRREVSGAIFQGWL